MSALLGLRLGQNIFYRSYWTQLPKTPSCFINGLELQIYPEQAKRSISGSLISVLQRTNPSVKFPPGLFQRMWRSYKTQIETPLPVGSFFDRNEEITSLKNMLKGIPQLSIISGPPDSGKTFLIRRVLKELSEQNQRAILHFDLRERNFSTVNGLLFLMEGAMRAWLDRCKEITNPLKEKGNYAFNLAFETEEMTPSLQPIEKLKLLLPLVSEQLPSYHWWSDQQSPILFIDEASRMRWLLTNSDGHKALNELFKWFVKNTKQEPRFHVILAASDSFFHLWIEQFIESSRLTNCVIGHLSQEDAKRFWEKRILTQGKRLGELESPKFEDAYEVCGGNMFLLEKYFSEYCLNGKTESVKPFDPHRFSLVSAERRQLMNAFFGSTFFPYGPNPYINPSSAPSEPRWERNDFVKLLEMLVNSEDGFILYADLCDEIGKSIVDDFIETNIIQFRPSRCYSNDIPNHPTEAIITPKTASAMIAMKEILRDMKNDKLK
ncbi:MAG: ATP-binding protein [Chlamydiales bacterium]